MLAALTNSFLDLLEQAGARPARFGKKWYCPRCPDRKSPSLSITWQGEVFFCHRGACGWKGNRKTLERDLGVPVVQPPPAEQQEQNLLGAESERFLRWWRWRWRFYRDLNWDLQQIERDARASGIQALAAGEPIPNYVSASLDFAVGKQKELWPELCRLSNHENNFTFLFAEYQSSKRGWEWTLTR